MIKLVEDAVAALRAAVASVEPSRLHPADAERLVQLLAEGERLCQAGRSLASQRVLRTRFWRARGFRTPAQWMASCTKGTLSQAIAAVETAHRIDNFPATREAFLSGHVSEVQAAEITAAAASDPRAEGGLLAMADQTTVAVLRERCCEVRAAAESDEDMCERIRRGRYLRHWNDRDGAIRFDARLAPDDGAHVITALLARARRLQIEARRSGQSETADAYTADALVSLAKGETGAKAVVNVHVDNEALQRGRTVAGETCKIPGIGPIPVTSARRLAEGGIVKALATDGADVHAVAHLGRTIPARLRTALEARDPTCVVPGCDVRTGLEIDHVVPLARGGPTALDNLARLCRYHHAEKTHHGWQLEGRPGAWTWIRRRGQRANSPARAP
jgi:uncharacterized protein DUF222/HNH endonuclease